MNEKTISTTDEFENPECRTGNYEVTTDNIIKIDQNLNYTYVKPYFEIRCVLF